MGISIRFVCDAIPMLTTVSERQREEGGDEVVEIELDTTILRHNLRDKEDYHVYLINDTIVEPMDHDGQSQKEGPTKVINDIMLGTTNLQEFGSREGVCNTQNPLLLLVRILGSFQLVNIDYFPILLHYYFD